MGTRNTGEACSPRVSEIMQTYTGVLTLPLYEKTFIQVYPADLRPNNAAHLGLLTITYFELRILLFASENSG